MEIKNTLLLFLLTVISSFLISCSDDGGSTPPDFEPVMITSDINENTVLENINEEEGEIDYIVTDYLEVRAELTIEPGVVIAFQANAGFFVKDVNSNGVLSAIGTPSLPVIFTGLAKTAGFWRGIAVESNDVRNELNHTIVEYAGSDPIAAYGGVSIRGGVGIVGASGFDGSLKVLNTTIQHCDGYGLIVEEGTLLRAFSTNTFVENTLAAVRIDAENVKSLDGSSSYANNNGVDGVEINASGSPIHNITEDATWPALANGAVYRVAQSFNVRAELTIMPGAILEFEANQTAAFKQDLDIPLGIIIARGTATNPITFTGVAKTPGYWRGLIIQSNSVLNEMDHCIVEYGGSDPIAGELANIGVEKDGAYDSPSLTLTNTTIRQSAGCGVVVETIDSNFTESDNTFSDNAGSNICD